jgi:hypothetical protein
MMKLIMTALSAFDISEKLHTFFKLVVYNFRTKLHIFLSGYQRYGTRQ